MTELNRPTAAEKLYSAFHESPPVDVRRNDVRVSMFIWFCMRKTFSKPTLMTEPVLRMKRMTTVGGCPARWCG